MTLAEQARLRVTQVKQCTTTFREALDKLRDDEQDVKSMATSILFTEMYAAPHGGYKETVAVGATVNPCIMKHCDDPGELELDDGSWICENCAQIQGELAPGAEWGLE